MSCNNAVPSVEVIGSVAAACHGLKDTSGLGASAQFCDAIIANLTSCAVQ